MCDTERRAPWDQHGVWYNQSIIDHSALVLDILLLSKAVTKTWEHNDTMSDDYTGCKQANILFTVETLLYYCIPSVQSQAH